MVDGKAHARRDVFAFSALVLFATVMYAVPGEWIPALAPARLALVSSGLGAGLMVLRRVGRGEPLFLDGARGVALLAFTGLAVASIGWSVHPVVTQFTAIELAKLTAIYLTLVNVVTNQRRLMILAGAIVLASIVTSVGVIQYFFAGANLVEGYRARWVGVYADPNHMAMGVALVVPLAIAFVARKGTPWLFRLACIAAAALAVTAIIFSYSRGGFLGLLTATALWLFREKRRFQAVVLGAVLALGMVVFAPERFWNRTETVTTFHQDASAMGRVYAWQVASRISLDKPLLGVGAGAFRFAWFEYAPVEATRAYVAHNIFLDVVGELGWTGLLLFLVFVGGTVGGAFRASHHAEVGWLARALAASVAGYLVCDLFSGYILSAHLYVLFGLAACADRLARTSEATALAVQRMPAAGASPARAAWEG